MNKLFIFLAGAIVGSVVTLLVKNRYENSCVVVEDSQSVEEPEHVDEEDIAEVDEEPEDDHYEDYMKVLGRCGYSVSAKDKKEEEKMKGPHVISPEEFDDYDYYCISFTYYADGIMTDDFGEIVDNVSEVVGDAINHFGEYEEDCVYVVDEELQVVYEILRDLANYNDATNSLED